MSIFTYCTYLWDFLYLNTYIDVIKQQEWKTTKLAHETLDNKYKKQIKILLLVSHEYRHLEAIEKVADADQTNFKNLGKN